MIVFGHTGIQYSISNTFKMQTLPANSSEAECLPEKGVVITFRCLLSNVRK